MISNGNTIRVWVVHLFLPQPAFVFLGRLYFACLSRHFLDTGRQSKNNFLLQHVSLPRHQQFPHPPPPATANNNTANQGKARTEITKGITVKAAAKKTNDDGPRITLENHSERVLFAKGAFTRILISPPTFLFVLLLDRLLFSH